MYAKGDLQTAARTAEEIEWTRFSRINALKTDPSSAWSDADLADVDRNLNDRTILIRQQIVIES